tara:strand:- start:771 stop:1493 length:723 start_codon:yes stop_codon:yes gene_type:complete
MASTFSTRLKIELIGDGEQSGSWGTTTNNNFSQSIEQAIAGVLTVATTGTGTTTLTTSNGPQAAADNQARQAALRFTSSEVSHTVQYPAVEKLYLLVNGSSTCTFTHRLGASGSEITLLPSKTKFVATDGTNWFTLETTGSTYIDKSGPYTAFAGDNIFVDTSGGAVTITLPSSPALGDAVSFIDAEGTFDSFNLTVTPDGSNKIMGLGSNGDSMIVDTNNAGFTLVYRDSTHGWRLKDK